MIGYLKGVVLDIGPSYCLILTPSGVGYEVSIPSSYLKELSKGKEINLYIKTILKEENIELYGFFSKGEKEDFELLLAINKLGPKIAMKIISLFSFEELEKMVIKEDWESLIKVPGIGPKMAKRILWELKEKISRSKELKSHPINTIYLNVVSALVNLGYKEKEVKDTLSKLIGRKKIKSEKELIKEALRHLSKRFAS